jgi:16S rRNA (uracil1498-N3)-methyltransferase
VERADRAPVSTFYAPGAWGRVVELDAESAHHATVKRLAAGDPVRLTGGDGRRASGSISTLGKRRLSVALDEASLESVPPPTPVELWAPVGDRDRMLWFAEKATELGVSAWRPIVYRRSRSVSPRGEGEPFREKLRRRTISALEQSGGAWLPGQHAESPLGEVLAASTEAVSLLLDAGGHPLVTELSPFTSHPSPFTVRLAVGPEGGLDPDERAAYLDAGWRPASLGSNVLRFETAGVAALAIVHSLLG